MFTNYSYRCFIIYVYISTSCISNTVYTTIYNNKKKQCSCLCRIYNGFSFDIQYVDLTFRINKYLNILQHVFHVTSMFSNYISSIFFNFMITLLHVFPSSKRIRSGPRVHMIIDPNVCLRRGTDQLKEFPVTSFVL